MKQKIEGGKKLSSIDKAIEEVRQHQEWQEEQRKREYVMYEEKYYTQDGTKYYAVKIGDGDWKIEELEEFPFIKYNPNL